MNKFETTINTLHQLKKLINKEHWSEIQRLEREDDRYTIALVGAISCINSLEQIRWESDVAIEQLHELGLSLGQKVDHVKELIDKDKLKPLVNYDNGGNKCISKRCPNCFEMIGCNCWKFCPECGQRIDN